MFQLDSGIFQQVKDLVFFGYYLNDIQGLVCLIVLLFVGIGVESFECFVLECFCFCGVMIIISIEDFVCYLKGYVSVIEKVCCFIDVDYMIVCLVFNIGMFDNFGYVDNVVFIMLKQIVLFCVLFQINGECLK